ncbi:Bystin-domain-containing protein [Lineolata rhizophorae]|uniref:Bystin-domain-containing protein n=1 Tax=Lineolata rhizophorae TaxID=578093 RepID=A0A6A6PDP6_9PEZI|nr:Bystin-domain-containing protein [Lineolata rhizophorae]
MPKVSPTSPRASTAAVGATRRHNPLADDYIPNRAHKPARQKQLRRKSAGGRDADEDGLQRDAYVDSKASKRILRIGREMVEEDEVEAEGAEGRRRAFEFGFGREDADVGEEDDQRWEGGEEDEEAWGSEEEVEEVEVDPADLATFNRFNPSFDDPLLRGAGLGGPTDDGQENAAAGGAAGGTDLAALILEKIAAHEAMAEMNAEDTGVQREPEEAEIPPKVVEVYTKCGHLLSRHRSGPLPKPLKLLPHIPAWPTLLSLTNPSSWTPHAVLAMTRLFASAPSTTAQSFYSQVLLPAVRSDLADAHSDGGTRKLNVHLYAALRKALYKPAAWFKGVLFPLLDARCSAREARVLGSVLARVRVPPLHAAAALQRVCEIAAAHMMVAGGGGGGGAVLTSASLEAGAAANTLILVLLNKKYALPYKVVDALVFHFLRFRGVAAAAAAPGPGHASAADTPKLPVIWHQTLLAFAQRYRNDVTEDQREALLDLLLVCGHEKIGPEVRRELLEGRGRGNDGGAVGGAGAGAGMDVGDGGDDTMMVVDG